VDLSYFTPKQAQELSARLVPALGYLTRLTNRMQQRGWKSDDPAYVAAWQARDALHELTVRLHYQRQGNPGCSKPAEPPPRPWEPGGGGRSGA
jgi:hypothetical protein